MTPEEIRQIEEYAASGQPVSAEAAQGVIRLFDRFGRRRRAVAAFLPLDRNEQLALACRASAWPEERIAEILHISAPAVRPLLLGTLSKLAHNLGPGESDNRSGGLPSLAAAKPVAREGQEQAPRHGERLVRAIPVDWNGEGGSVP